MESPAEKLLCQYRVLLLRKKSVDKQQAQEIDDLLHFIESLVDTLRECCTKGVGKKMYEVIKQTYMTQTPSVIEDILVYVGAACGSDKPMPPRTYRYLLAKALEPINQKIKDCKEWHPKLYSGTTQVSPGREML